MVAAVLKQLSLSLLLLTGMGGLAGAIEPDRLLVGARTGYSASSFVDPFHLNEIYLDWYAKSRPWRLESHRGWLCQTRIELSAGCLNGQDHKGFVGTLGPNWLLGNKHFPLFFDFGSSFTYLSRHQYGPTDFGVPLQFTTHVGGQLRLGSRVSLLYRLQHMSNAGQEEPNPGLDLHMFGVEYHF
jgi:hypothetical protein